MYLSIDELEYRFIWEVCKSFFTGIYGHLFIYILAVIVVTILGDYKARRVFVYPAMVLVLTVFNPLIMNYVIKRLGMEGRYYRFFWLLPIGVTVAYALALIYDRLKKKIIWVALAGVLAVLIVVTGTNALDYRRGAENVLKISQYDVMVDEAIRADCEDEEITCAYLDPTFVMLRSYDAGILNTFKRSQWLYWAIDLEDDDAIQREIERKNSSYVLAMLLRYGIQTDVEVFQNAIQENGVQYMIVTESPEINAYFSSMGYEQIYYDSIYAVYRTY